jgi:hypothetical protein
LRKKLEMKESISKENKESISKENSDLKYKIRFEVSKRFIKTQRKLT